MLKQKRHLRLRILLLPKVKEDINYGKNFAKLRQIYHSMILALVFKQKVVDSFYRHYINKEKIKGIDIADKDVKTKIWKLYCDSFKKGTYNLNKTQQSVTRNYFCGGFDASSALSVVGKVDISTEQLASSATGPLVEKEVVLSSNVEQVVSPKSIVLANEPKTLEEAVDRYLKHKDDWIKALEEDEYEKAAELYKQWHGYINWIRKNNIQEEELKRKVHAELQSDLKPVVATILVQLQQAQTDINARAAVIENVVGMAGMGYALGSLVYNNLSDIPPNVIITDKIFDEIIKRIAGLLSNELYVLSYPEFSSEVDGIVDSLVDEISNGLNDNEASVDAMKKELRGLTVSNSPENLLPPEYFSPDKIKEKKEYILGAIANLYMTVRADGSYNTELTKVFVTPRASGEYARSTIIHEITHYLNG